MDDRRFTDDEVRRILKKAVERRPASRALVTGDGLTLAEIKSIGEEVGIDPARLEDAARSVVVQEGTTGMERFLGGPTVLSYERRIPGTFDPEDTTDVVAAARRVMGHQGEISELRGSLDWSHEGEGGDRHITVSSRDGHITVRGATNLTKSAGLIFVPGAAGGSVTTLAALAMFSKSGAELALIVGLATLPALYPLLRFIMNRISRSEERRLQQAVDEIVRLLDRSDE